MRNTDLAYQNASAWMDTINEYAKALDPETWERLEELREMADEDLTKEDWEERAHLAEIEEEYQDEDHAREMAEESALSLELSGTWAPGETPTADRFEILLSAGGPALRIVGELNEYNEPDRAWLEYQDWGTPWTEYHGDNTDQDALLAFCQCFYFGE